MSQPAVITNFKDIPVDGIKGLLLDFDNTLYEYKPCHEKAFAACKKAAEIKYGIKPQQFDEHMKTARDTVHHELHSQGASHSRLLYFHKMHESLFSKSNSEFAIDLEEIYWSTFLEAMKFDEEAEDFLKRAKSNGIKICIITDLTTHIQMRKWQRFKLDRYIDFLVTSEEAGIEKPERPIFDMALRKLRMNIEQVIMVGDDYLKDVAGPTAIGIKSYQVSLK